MSFLAEPVVPTDTIFTAFPFILLCSSLITSFTAFIGLPLVQRYELARILLFSSIITPLVEIDPMSIPK